MIPKDNLFNCTHAQVMRGGLVVNSFVGYCPCGAEIWIEYLFDGHAWFNRFFDQDFNEISECPSCQRTLIEDDLLSLDACNRGRDAAEHASHQPKS
jgi:hypothetical protein